MKWVQSLEKTILYISILLLNVLLVMVVLQVFCRNLLGFSFTFIEEFSMIFLSWCGFFSATYALRKKAHVAVEFFYEKMPAPIQRAVYIGVLLVILGFLLYITYYGFGLAKRQMMIPMAVTGVPRGWMYYSLPVSSLLMSLFCFLELMTAWKKPKAFQTQEGSLWS